MSGAGRIPLVTRILASAGSGKTFALTSRYLALVQRGVDPSRILATTFSRAAAAEILARVLRRAADAVLDEGKREELAKAMADDDASLGERSFDAAAAAKLLEGVVRGLPRLQICTLDSFFAGVIGAFATELGVGAALRVMDDGEERMLLLDAISTAMEEEDEEALLATILSLVHGKRVASVVRTAEQEVEGLLEILSNTAPGAWDWDVRPAIGNDLEQALLERMTRLAEKKEGGGNVAKSVRSDAAKLETAMRLGGDAWHPNRFGKLAGSAVAGDPIEYGDKPVPESVADAYRDLADVILTESAAGYARMTKAMHVLATSVAMRRTRLAHSRLLASFGDLTALLDPQRNPQPELAEVWFRLDGRIQHLLLDEFQDTSVVQWRALQRLVEEIVAGGEDPRSLFAVGDVKQAIYGWRGGEPRLLAELQDVLADGATVELDERRLVRSYRASPCVIAFVNRLFSAVGSHADLEPTQLAAAQRWSTRFPAHETAIDDAPGMVEVVAVPFGDGGYPDLAAQITAVRERVRALRARLPATANIGVIARRNTIVARVARALQRDGHAVRVIGRGALLDREATLVVLQALRLAEWPGDTMAAFDLACSPLRDLVGLDCVEPFTTPSLGDAAEASRMLRRAFESRGIATVVDEWRRHLAPLLDDHERLRLEQLVAVIERLATTVDRSPGEIAGLVGEARVEHAAGGEVAVMNVHQCKGLEFDAVIVLDLESKLEGLPSNRKVAWSSPSRPTDPVPHVVRWLQADLIDRLTEMGAVCRATIERQTEESLAVLYVALTRAKRELCVVVSETKPTKDGGVRSCCAGTLAALVRSAVANGEERPDPHDPAVWFRDGEPWSPAVAVEGRAAAPAAGAPPPPHIRPATRARHRARAASEAESATASLRLRDREAVDRGIAFHAALARVGWLDDHRDDVELLEAMRIALPSRDTGWLRARLVEVRTALERPRLRDLLTRRSPRAELRTEYPFVRVVTLGLQTGAIDRLVVHREFGGRVERAELVDYKTDAIPADELDALRVRHAEQLRVYRDVVASHFGLAPERVAVRLFALAHDAVVEFAD
ncbi:MAG: UvrD-helicase domain-containing protein [Planctomycetes bacterium]|nr:UvrD-helicase domain-containing protein [Planctomycetota bacterium]